MVGETFLHFKIIAEIDKGGMGTVYYVRNENTGDFIALKVLHLEFANNKKVRQRFVAEAKILQKLKHENIVEIFEIVDAGDFVAFSMEYIEGKSLKKIIEDSTSLDDQEISGYMIQILNGLNYVHNKGLIHRDIKPSNLYLSSTGKIKILDFGIAKDTENDNIDFTGTSLHDRMGTVGYMSPEQLISTKNVRKQTDIYSLGVVLWEMVEGRRLYDLNKFSVPEIHASILNDTIPLTYTSWDSQIQKACSKNENRRYVSCGVWLDEINLKHRSSDMGETKLENWNVKSLINKKFRWYDAYFLIIPFLIIYFLTRQDTSKEKNQVASVIALKKEENVKIAGFLWMKKDIESECFNNGDSIFHAKNKEDWKYAIQMKIPAYCYYEFDKQNEGIYGVYYNHYAITDKRGIIPDGYVIPDNQMLKMALENGSVHFRSAGVINMLGDFIAVGENKTYWSSDIDSDDREKAFLCLLTMSNNIFSYCDFRGMGMKLKCIEIPSKKIGNNVWMSVNLNVSRFNNGDLIPEAKTAEEWINAGERGIPAWCFYNNDPNNGKKYGKLYNWYAVNDPRGLAPKGWHVASANEWRDLIENTDDIALNSKVIKSNTGWMENGNGSNKYGFSALPGGYISSLGEFKDMGYSAFWYTTSLNNEETAVKIDIVYNSDNVRIGYNKFAAGFAVRCVKNK
jgi:uncharacterized protein (TIGR02145 family)